MALDSKAEASLAFNRFGLGPRTGSIAAIASDPRGALVAELDRPSAGHITNLELMSSGVAARSAFAFQQAQRELRRAAKSAPKDAKDAKDAAEVSPPAGATPAPARPNVGTAPQQLYLDEAKARLGAALGAEIGF